MLIKYYSHHLRKYFENTHITSYQLSLYIYKTHKNVCHLYIISIWLNLINRTIIHSWFSPLTLHVYFTTWFMANKQFNIFAIEIENNQTKPIRWHAGEKLFITSYQYNNIQSHPFTHRWQRRKTSESDLRTKSSLWSHWGNYTACTRTHIHVPRK